MPYGRKGIDAMAFPEGRKDWTLIMMIIIQVIQAIIDAFDGDNNANAGK